MIFNAPKYFTQNNLITFLSEVEKIFSMKNAMKENVIFDLSKVAKTNILGILLMYKFIEYTHCNYCFRKPQVKVNEYIIEKLKEYGFWLLINSYISNKDISESIYNQLKIKVENNFIIAPQPLIRNDKCSTEILKKKFLPKIEEYYSFNDKMSSMIFLCLSEIFLNFWEHAVLDTKSILVAEGNKLHIEIACADTGNGIITTLGSTLSSINLSKEKIISESLKKGVTSKKMTNHMGYGLWILNEIVTLTKGRLHLYSEGAYILNDFGKITKGTCAFWQGTIIYLSLPLLNPKTLSDIDDITNSKKLDDIKINFQ